MFVLQIILGFQANMQVMAITVQRGEKQMFVVEHYPCQDDAHAAFGKIYNSSH